MISNQKIYKIATALKEFSGPRDFNSPTSVLNFLTQNVDQKSEYIRAFGPEAFVKICIAYWGISKDMTLQQIESIYDKLFFANVFFTYGEMHEEDCEYCSGDGSQECDQCDGSGNMSCRACEGDGEIECTECGGEGEVEVNGDWVSCEKCDGSGNVKCDECDGDGTEECDECYGRGTEECDNCNGGGTVFSDYLKDYHIQFIVSWSEVLKNKCELSQEQVEPIAITDKFIGSQKHIVLSEITDYNELIDEVEDRYVYCLQYFGDSPTLRFDGIRGTKILSPGWDESHLLA